MNYILLSWALVLAAGLQNLVAAEVDGSKLAMADNVFAFKLVNQVLAEQPGRNIFISPYSAATALQMTANGAGGQTKSEMQRVLGTSGISPDLLNSANQQFAYDLAHPKSQFDRNLGYSGLSHMSDAEFQSISNTAVKYNPDSVKPPTETNIIVTANALFYRPGDAIKSGFVETNQKYFSSAVKPLDFSDPAAAEAAINRWGTEQTQGRVNGIADGLIDPLYSDLILANAIYFYGKWQNPFVRKLTRERRFYPPDGPSKRVPMMEVSAKFGYSQCDDFQMVSMPYKDARFTMLVLLPAPGSSPAKVMQSFTGDNWRAKVYQGLTCPKGHLVLPKFKLENTLKLTEPLKALGMKTAFDPAKADFSGMFDDAGHCLTKVRQKTFLTVDEAGTEAAAVTEVERGTYGAPEKPPKPFDLVVDRPFLFLILDSDHGLILFMGVVNDL